MWQMTMLYRYLVVNQRIGQTGILTEKILITKVIPIHPERSLSKFNVNPSRH